MLQGNVPSSIRAIQSPSEGDPATLLRPAGEDVLEVCPVSKQVNSTWTKGTELLDEGGY